MDGLCVDLGIGETVRVDDISIKLIQKSGRIARLNIVADKSVIVQVQSNNKKDDKGHDVRRKA